MAGGNVKIPVRVEGQTLRTTESAEERRYAPVAVNRVNGIAARQARSRNEKPSVRPESHMVRRDRWFQLCKNFAVLVAQNIVNRS